MLTRVFSSTRSCDSETHDNTDTIPVSVPSSVSPGGNSEIFPEELNVACWSVNTSVAHQDFLHSLGSVQAQVLLLQKIQNFTRDDDSSSGEEQKRPLHCINS